MSGTASFVTSSMSSSALQSALNIEAVKQQQSLEITTVIERISSETKAEVLEEVLKKVDESKLEPIDKLEKYIDLVARVVNIKFPLSTTMIKQIEAKFAEFMEEFAKLAKVNDKDLTALEEQIEFISKISSDWVQQIAKQLSAYKNKTIQQIKKKLANAYEERLKTLAEMKLIEAKADAFYLTQTGSAALDKIFSKKHDELTGDAKELYALIKLDLTVLSRFKPSSTPDSVNTSAIEEDLSTLEGCIRSVEDHENQKRKVISWCLQYFSLPMQLPLNNKKELENLSESLWKLNKHHQLSNLEKLQECASRIVKQSKSAPDGKAFSRVPSFGRDELSDPKFALSDLEVFSSIAEGTITFGTSQLFEALINLKSWGYNLDILKLAQYIKEFAQTNSAQLQWKDSKAQRAGVTYRSFEEFITCYSDQLYAHRQQDRERAEEDRKKLRDIMAEFYSAVKQARGELEPETQQTKVSKKENETKQSDLKTQTTPQQNTPVASSSSSSTTLLANATTSAAAHSSSQSTTLRTTATTAANTFFATSTQQQSQHSSPHHHQTVTDTEIELPLLLFKREFQ